MTRQKKLTSLKRWLFAALAVGLLASSGSGTFASFNAQATNKTSSIASGTLTLSDRVNSGNICLTSGGSVGAPATNKNPTCTAILAVNNVEPGSWNPSLQSAKVTVRDIGSLNASTFVLQATKVSTSGSPNCVDTTTTAAPSTVTLTGVKLTTGSTTLTDTTGFGTVTPGMSITGSHIPYNSSSPTKVVAIYGTKMVISQAATATTGTGEAMKFYSSTKISSVSVSSAHAYLTHTGGFPLVTVGMSVTGTNIQKYTVVTKVTGTRATISLTPTGTASETVTFGANYGTDVNFNTATPLATKPFCGEVVMYVQESATVGGTTDYYCWFGYGGHYTGTSEASTKGLCAAPLLTTLKTTITCKATTTSIKLSTVTGPIFSTDIITIASGTKKCRFKAKSGPYAPTTSTKTITVTYQSGTGSFAAGSNVSDVTTATHLNTTSNNTIKKFDQLHGTTGQITLYPITGAGVVTKTAPVRLGSLSARTFTIGLYLPLPTSGTQNQYQGLKTSFSLSWYIQQ